MPLNKAKQLAEQSFPNGPEKLAAKLGIAVRATPLTGCDGWVLFGPAGTIIHLNSTLTVTRRRFTLAHELGHLLLGVPTIIGESIYDSLRSNSDEERRVNELASELLLPEKIVKESIPTVPVVASQLCKLARKAKVSELAAALRVANLAERSGLVNASVAFFNGGQFEWHWSRTLRMPGNTAAKLLNDARKCHPRPFRALRKKTNDVIVASIIENPSVGSSTLFVQLLPADVGNQLTNDERRRELESYLFRDDREFQMQLQGVFGAFHRRCENWDIESAVAAFYEEKAPRWDGARHMRLYSAKGREYVRLRLAEWCI